jgi:hypothetical protein
VREKLQYVGACDGSIGTDCFGGLQSPAAGEDCQSTEYQLFGGRQQIVTPLERGLQRLLPSWGGAAAAHQQSEALVEPFQHLTQRERRQTSRSEFERQRKTFQARAQRSYRRRISGPQDEVCLDCHSPLDE